MYGTYREDVTAAVRMMMDYVASKVEIYEGYELILSGSTRENVRVRDPFEMDFLLVINIPFNWMECSDHLGFVKVSPLPSDTERLSRYTSNAMLIGKRIRQSLIYHATLYIRKMH